MCLANLQLPSRPPYIRYETLPNSWDDVEGGQDWVVVDKGPSVPSDEQLAEFEKEVLRYMPKISQDGVSEPRKPWKGQLLALYKLCRDKVDTILSARTGYGKSIIYQLAPLLYPGGGKALIISSLIALSNDQEKGLAQFKEFGARGLVIKGENNSEATRSDAVRGNYMHSMSF